MPLLALFSAYTFEFCYTFYIFFSTYQAELSFISRDSLEISCRGHAAMALCLWWKRDESRLSAILLTAVSSLNETPSNCCFFSPSIPLWIAQNALLCHFPPDGGCLLSFCEWFLQTCVSLPSIKCSSRHSSMCSGWEFLWLIRIVLRAKQKKKRASVLSFLKWEFNQFPLLFLYRCISLLLLRVRYFQLLAAALI